MVREKLWQDTDKGNMWYLNSDGLLTVFDQENGTTTRQTVKGDKMQNQIKIVGDKKWNNILYVDSKISILDWAWGSQNKGHVVYYRVNVPLSDDESSMEI